MGRRPFVATALGGSLATACAGGTASSGDDLTSGSADGDSSATSQSSLQTDGSSSADDGSGSSGGNGAPVWMDIPDQSIAVGAPFMVDLADYVEDPEGDALVFAQVAGALPEGLQLEGSVISGTPTATGNSGALQFSADDEGA